MRPLLGMAVGVAGAAAVGTLCLTAGHTSAVCWTASITALCAAWWILEPVPIPATSLIPFALFPLVGVLDHRQVATAYGHTLILLLLASFVLSTSMERCGAHRRLALGLARLLEGRAGGTTPRRLVLGFLLAAAIASMWISNAATTVVLVPIALAVLERDANPALAASVLLAICYGASIGGLGTPIGTPPNLLFLAAYTEATGRSWSFLEWMRIGLPAVAVLIPAAYWVLTRKLPQVRLPSIAALGPWQPAERRVLAVFALTALAWITRTGPAGGWQAWLGLETPGDATVALVAVVALFLLPDGRGHRLLDWPTARTIPWGILLLFGGGLALALAFETSGLSRIVGERLGSLAEVPPFLMIFTVCLSVTFLTEVTSNTATVALLMPLLASAANSAGIEPARLMLPAALSGSCAFMLPVATAPNAIVFGTGRVSTAQMARAGFGLNLLGAVLVALVCWQLL